MWHFNVDCRWNMIFWPYVTGVRQMSHFSNFFQLFNSQKRRLRNWIQRFISFWGRKKQSLKGNLYLQQEIKWKDFKKISFFDNFSLYSAGKIKYRNIKTFLWRLFRLQLRFYLKKILKDGNCIKVQDGRNYIWFFFLLSS